MRDYKQWSAELEKALGSVEKCLKLMQNPPEIKNEPVSAHDAARSVYNRYGYTPTFCIGEMAIELVKAGEANEKLRHQPQQTFEEHRDSVLPSWDMEGHEPAYDSGAMRNCWKAAQKAVGHA